MTQEKQSQQSQQSHLITDWRERAEKWESEKETSKVYLLVECEIAAEVYRKCAAELERYITQP